MISNGKRTLNPAVHRQRNGARRREAELQLPLKNFLRYKLIWSYLTLAASEIDTFLVSEIGPN